MQPQKSAIYSIPNQQLHKTRGERLIRYGLQLPTLLSVLLTLAIAVLLVWESLEFFQQVSLRDFLGGRQWAPTMQPQSFGVLPLLSGTLVFTFYASLIAIPISLATAFFLSEYASPKLKKLLKPMLELLAGLPTVVYGYFALVYVTPALRHVFPSIETFNVLSAAIVVAVMIIPSIASISEDAINAVPQSLREASYALGAQKHETCLKVLFPASISGLISAFILGISRAIGETMAVSIAAGNLARLVNPLDLHSSLLKPIQTMTSAIVEIGISDVSGDSLAYKSLFAIGLLLFTLTLIMNSFSQLLKHKFREKYL